MSVILRGGPVDGAIVVPSPDSRSIVVTGEDHGAPGMVARYRLSKATESVDGEELRVYRFKEWDRVVMRLAR